MQGYNVILVLNPSETQVLFCLRQNDPYKGLFNLVGGKIEPNEDGLTAAYRELEEESGITKQDITPLFHLIDFTYYPEGCYVEAYACKLKHDVTLVPEKHPLFWLNTTEDFYSMSQFSGEGNIGHIYEHVCFYHDLIFPKE